MSVSKATVVSATYSAAGEQFARARERYDAVFSSSLRIYTVCPFLLFSVGGRRPASLMPVPSSRATCGRSCVVLSTVSFLKVSLLPLLCASKVRVRVGKGGVLSSPWQRATTKSFRNRRGQGLAYRSISHCREASPVGMRRDGQRCRAVRWG